MSFSRMTPSPLVVVTFQGSNNHMFRQQNSSLKLLRLPSQSYKTKTLTARATFHYSSVHTAEGRRLRKTCVTLAITPWERQRRPQNVSIPTGSTTPVDNARIATCRAIIRGGRLNNNLSWLPKETSRSDVSVPKSQTVLLKKLKS